MRGPPRRPFPEDKTHKTGIRPDLLLSASTAPPVAFSTAAVRNIPVARKRASADLIISVAYFRASSQISASESEASIGTLFSMTYFSLSGIAPGGSTLCPTLESSRAKSAQVG